MLVFLVPFAVITTAPFWYDAGLLFFGLNMALCILFCAMYGYYTSKIRNKGWILGFVFWPLALIQEILIVVMSVLKYRRQTIEWKGRPIRPEAQS